MFENKQKHFIEQQGYGNSSGTGEPFGSCSAQYGALQFQPRVVGVIFLIGMVFQSPAIFFGLAVLLAVGAWRPALNPFEALYNRTLGRRPGAEQLSLAPPPRRFAQGLAAGFSILIAACLFFRRPIWAYLLELMMVAALIALIFFGFCLGAVVYHAYRGNWEYAKKTLPWS